MKKNNKRLKEPPNNVVLDFGIGNRKIFICWGSDFETKDFFANHQNAPEIFNNNCEGMTVGSKLWICDGDSMPLLAHELLHAIYETCKEMGIEFENELFAYKLSDLMGQYINKRKLLNYKQKLQQNTDISV